MQRQQRTLNVIAVPAGERQPPGWFALHPEQFATEAERLSVHGRWHCLSTSHGRVFRVLQLREDLPANGIALDWAARNVLERGRRGAIAGSQQLQLKLRPARLMEYPRCLFGHPNPNVRLASYAGITTFLLIPAFLGGLLLSDVVRLNPASSSPPVVVSGVAVPTDTATFIQQQLAGDWQAPNEQLQIRQDKGVVALLRQSAPEKGEVQLDFYAAAPVRFDASAHWLELETPEGIWRLALVPGARRTSLHITYPDNRQLQYE